MATVTEMAKRARVASRALSQLPLEARDEALRLIAQELHRGRERILTANHEDVTDAKRCGLENSMISRLKLDEGKFEAMAEGIEKVMSLADPLGQLTLKSMLAEDLILKRETCPIGVLAIIYEARPEAGVQIASLCLKSGNALLLKGGKETFRSNEAVFRCFQSGLKEAQKKFGEIPEHAIQLVETRAEVTELLQLDKLIDLVIPRGSNGLVKYVQDNTKIPVLGHSDGLCAIYVDERVSDMRKAVEVIVDSKTNYVAACNSVETLLVHKKMVSKLLPELAKALAAYGVQFRADSVCIEELPTDRAVLASEEDWKVEFLDYILAVKCVESVAEAVAHINEHGSHHTDAIISDSLENVAEFEAGVDSACVFTNCSTRFSDGNRFGFGAEVGICTSKIHSRGPVGLEGLVIYKYKLSGQGHLVGRAGLDFHYLHKRLDLATP